MHPPAPYEGGTHRDGRLPTGLAADVTVGAVYLNDAHPRSRPSPARPGPGPVTVTLFSPICQ